MLLSQQYLKRFSHSFSTFHLLLILGFILLFGLLIAKQKNSFTSPTIKQSAPAASEIKENAPSIYYISPSGNDGNSGKSSTSPWKTIQKAINIAGPGDTINLGSGIYFQDMRTKVNGTADSPITLIGSKDTIIKGGGKTRVFEVNHNNIILKGFTIDGLFGDPNKVKGYRDKLLYVQGKGIRSGVTGLKVDGLQLKNAGGECLRLRYFAHDNEVTKTTIGPCGVADFKFPSKDKNGEGIYLGTSSNQWNDKKNPTNDPDGSTRNWIHHNTFNTQGNECLDAKEGSFGNIIEYNKCTGQRDSDSGGFDSRGDGNIFRHNEIYENLGTGIRLGGHTVGGVQYGKNNEVYANIIRNNKSGALSIQVLPQGKICENSMANNGSRMIVGLSNSSIRPDSTCR